jgi:integrase
MSIDPYNWERVFKSAVRHIKSNQKISDENKKRILEYVPYLESCDLSRARVIFHMRHVAKCAEILGKDFDAWTKKDVESLLAQFNRRGLDEETKHGYKVCLKKFLRWERGYSDKTTENGNPLFPPEVAWIRLTMKNKRIKLMPSMLLTDEELKQLIRTARGPMEKAYVITAGDGGWRPIEHLTLTVGAVHFDQFGARITVGGKVNPRIVRVVAAAPALREWLTVHPRRKDPNSPLWLDPKDDSKLLTYARARYMLKRIAKEAGVNKRVYTYLFRHSCVTGMAKKCSDSELKGIFGWTQGTRMLVKYVHLSGRDVDEAALAARGIRVESAREKSLLVPLICRRCGRENTVENRFCSTCGMPLQESDLVELDKTRELADDVMSKLIQHPLVEQAIRRALTQTGLWRQLQNMLQPDRKGSEPTSAAERSTHRS